MKFLLLVILLSNVTSSLVEIRYLYTIKRALPNAVCEVFGLKSQNYKIKNSNHYLCGNLPRSFILSYVPRNCLLTEQVDERNRLFVILYASLQECEEDEKIKTMNYPDTMYFKPPKKPRICCSKVGKEAKKR
jgi:hypothetical protein